jgi:YD repeat-containing protein
MSLEQKRQTLLLRGAETVDPPFTCHSGRRASTCLDGPGGRAEARGRGGRLDDARWGATTYAHDKLDQLVEARRGAHREVFEYDATGSLVKMLEGLEAEPRVARAWEMKPGNLVTQTDKAKYAYDKRGRRAGKIELAKFANGGEPTRDDLTRYFWDVRDRLREVKLPGGTRVVMSYDAFGRRIRKEVIQKNSGERARVVEFVWDGDTLAADIDTEHGGARCFVHEPGTLVPLMQAERGEVFTYSSPNGTARPRQNRLRRWDEKHSLRQP